MDYITPAIRDDFAAVNRLVIERLHSEVALVESIGQYIVEGGGKRMRPLITLLCARALGYPGTQHVELAAVIEFLHTATLLHDDVVDVSALRRGRATANANWGNAPSVLVGDFIYSRAFQVLVGIGDMDILRLMSDTTNIIAEGEVEQLARAGDPDATEAQYTQIIGKKTAVLFAAAAEGAAILAGATPGTRAAMRDYGMNLGLAFQLIDDVLDYTGDPQAMGKNLGDDLAEGKPTLPLIHAIAHAAPAAATVVRQAILGRDRDALADIVATVQSCGALDYTHRRAVHHRDLALAALNNVADSAFRQNLETIARMAVDRAS
ncbi:MAG: polyprenyl synthetase family protein [Gammaproteobacteria bacterium]|nr:polyprenyl synthetase family protein [Gammaproteobacteria bacterium]